MRVIATTTDTKIINKLTDNFWQALCSSRLIPGEEPGQLVAEQYGKELLSFTFEDENTDVPSWFISGLSSAGNYFGIGCNGDFLTVTASTTRHALRDSGNMAGLVFRLMLCRDVTRPTGHMIPYDPPVMGMETVVIPMEDILTSLEIQEYDSWRKDRPW